MTGKKPNLPASIAARLLNHAKRTGDDYQRRTFARRGTPIPADDPIALTNAYWENPSRPAQVRAFARRAGLSIPDAPGDEFVRLLGAFLAPILSDLRKGTWRPGGPWR